MVALRLVAALATQTDSVFLGLHAFGKHRQIHAVSQRDDRPHDGRVVWIGAEITDETLIDLEPCDRQLLDIAQG